MPTMKEMHDHVDSLQQEIDELRIERNKAQSGERERREDLSKTREALKEADEQINFLRGYQARVMEEDKLRLMEKEAIPPQVLRTAEGLFERRERMTDLMGYRERDDTWRYR